VTPLADAVFSDARIAFLIGTNISKARVAFQLGGENR